MRKKLLYRIFFFTFLCLSGCQSGADSIPELSSKVFTALQKHSQKLLIECEPSPKDMEKAMSLYLGDTSQSKETQKQEGINKLASYRLSLNQNFETVLKEAENKKIDWAKAVIKDFKYRETDHKQGYKDAEVRVILQTGSEKNVITYTAYLFEKKWYLIQGLAWEE